MAQKILFSVKTDKKLKKEAQEVAKKLGLPLSLVINQYLRQFVKDKQVTFFDTSKPNVKTSELFTKIVQDIENHKNISKSLNSFDEVKSHLKKLKE